jgi:hypothetical protein
MATRKAKAAAEAIDNFQTRLGNQQAEALDSWRDAIWQHVAGEDIDLEQLTAAAAKLRISGADMAVAFSTDVAAAEAWQAAKDKEATRREELDKLLPAAAEAKAKVERLQAEIAKVENSLGEVTAKRYSLADAALTARRAEQSSPRLFDEGEAFLAELSSLREVTFN